MDYCLDFTPPLIDQTIPDLVTFAGAGLTVSHTFTQWLPDVENNYIGVDCGPRTYTLLDSSDGSVSPFLTFDSGDDFKIDLKSDNASELTAGLVSVKLVVTFDNYDPLMTHEKFFNINIKDGCATAAFVDTQTYADIQVFAGLNDIATIPFNDYYVDYEIAVAGSDCLGRTYRVVDTPSPAGVTMPYLNVAANTITL